jgi:hypothetical protein
MKTAKWVTDLRNQTSDTKRNMKAIIRIFTLVVCFGILLMSSSCVVFLPKDSGKHAGWYKNSHNPHHPATTNPGKQKAKGRR